MCLLLVEITLTLLKSDVKLKTAVWKDASRHTLICLRPMIARDLSYQAQGNGSGMYDIQYCVSKFKISNPNHRYGIISMYRLRATDKTTPIIILFGSLSTSSCLPRPHHERCNDGSSFATPSVQRHTCGSSRHGVPVGGVELDQSAAHPTRSTPHGQYRNDSIHGPMGFAAARGSSVLASCGRRRRNSSSGTGPVSNDGCDQSERSQARQ